MGHFTLRPAIQFLITVSQQSKRLLLLTYLISTKPAQKGAFSSANALKIADLQCLLMFLVFQTH